MAKIKITCTKDEKEDLIDAFILSDVCFFACTQSINTGFEGECDGRCRENIECVFDWEITDE